MPESETPVLDVIAEMTASSLEHCELPLDQVVQLRIAALAAVGAGPLSYLAHVGPAVGAGVTLEAVQNVLVAVAPIIGSPKVMTASAGIAEALGLVVAVAEAEQEADG